MHINQPKSVDLCPSFHPSPDTIVRSTSSCLNAASQASLTLEENRFSTSSNASNASIDTALSRSRLVELAQPLLDLGELLLRLLDDLLEVVEALVVVLDVLGPVGALVGAEVLDLLAAVLDFRHAERCARAFQEVAERR